MKKNRIRLSESQLQRVIKESIMSVLRESRPMQPKWAKGLSESKRKSLFREAKSWRGCPNVHMIWHGEWSDPELEADGCVANYWDVENSLWYSFLEETGHSDSDSGNPQVEKEFNQWLQANESEVVSTIYEYGTES